MSKKRPNSAVLDHGAGTANVITEVRRKEALLKLSVELAATITPGFETLGFKAKVPFLKATKPTTTLKGASCVSSNNATKGLP